MRLVEGEDEDHPEKKSVMKKVKERAKKIKNTLTKQGHGHDQPDGHDLDEEEDEKDEDAEKHGATCKLLCA